MTERTYTVRKDELTDFDPAKMVRALKAHGFRFEREACPVKFAADGRAERNDDGSVTFRQAITIEPMAPPLFDRREAIGAGERFIAIILVAAGLMVLAALTPMLVQAAHGAEIVTVQSAAGPIEVAPAFAPRIVPVIAELKAAGFNGIVKCYARHRGPHVRHSLHLTGHACDFLPRPGARGARRRNRMPSPPIMFTHKAAELIAAAGLRNGCSFRDCGHVDTGLAARFARLP